MHGGSGWTVQYPDGSHKHVYEGGGIRTHDFSFENPFDAQDIVVIILACSLIAIIPLAAA